MTIEPVASRLDLPADYGLPEDSPLLSWATVDARLAKAPHYWLSTVGAGGAPSARPIDGMWVAAALYFSGDPNSRWRRNLDADPRACVTLEGAASAIILEGQVGATTPSPQLAAALAGQASAKYEWADPGADQYQVEMLVFKPRKVMAWSQLFEDATRFRFT